jgi:hypothetical protein
MYVPFPQGTTGLMPISYIGALLSTILHATLYVLHNLMNVLVEIANKIELQKNIHHRGPRAGLWHKATTTTLP